MKKYLNYLLSVAGILSLLLGIIGIFVPILPTTPFVLLSAWLFLKSSDRLHQKLIKHRYFGPMITQYQVHKAIPVRVKVYSLSLMWLCMSLSAFLCVENWWIRIILFLIAIGVTIHILSFKTLRN